VDACRTPHKTPIGVLGAGWVGIVTATCFAELGHPVIVRDVVPERIRMLERGTIPMYEPGLVEMFARNAHRMRFTTRMEDVVRDATQLFVCVGTPPTYSGDADLSAVWHVVDELPDVEQPLTLVMKSTVPPGTGEKVRARLDSRGRAHVGYVSNPEFLAEGTALRDFMHPDRVVVGDFRPTDGDRIVALYESMGAPILRTDVASAEMIKMASNAFLATKISFVNEIANVCEETGADVNLVAHGMGLDSRIGPEFLRAGIGYGGSCFPKDVAALKQLAGNSGYHFQLLTAVIEVNELQKRRVVAKLKKHLGPLREKTVALLGLAFKPNTSDMREASSLVLASRLVAEGARVRAWDPIALDEARTALHGVDLLSDPLEALRDADAAVVVTEWDALNELAFDDVAAVMARPLMIDGRNLLDPAALRAAGFVYEGIGRAVPWPEIVDLEAPVMSDDVPAPIAAHAWK
jgi:UDPglucose 6-dehydrogenase